MISNKMEEHQDKHNGKKYKLHLLLLVEKIYSNSEELVQVLHMVLILIMFQFTQMHV